MVPSQLHLAFKNRVPTKWSDFAMHSPEQRARAFFLPNCDDLALIIKAKKLVWRHVKPLREELSALAPEFQKMGGDGLLNEFWLTAKFHANLFQTAGVLLQHERITAESGAVHSLEFVQDRDCSARCRSLQGARFLPGSPLLARFAPPWHLYCVCQLRPSAEEPREPAWEPMEEDENYWCNPVDLLLTLSVRTYLPPAPPKAIPVSVVKAIALPPAAAPRPSRLDAYRKAPPPPRLPEPSEAPKPEGNLAATKAKILAHWQAKARPPSPE